MSVKQFKIRCSAISEIMTNDKSGKQMGKTAQSFCKDWLKEQLYGKRKEISSKFLEKGIICEQDAIDFTSEYLNLGMVFKNEEFFENEFLQGTPDLIIKDYVIDIKCSWNCFTFPLFEKEVDSKYFAQLQGYMHLTGKEKAMLVYCLIDTPENLISDEIRRLSWKLEYIEVPEEIEEQIRSNMIYSGCSDKLKIKVFEFNYDANYIECVINRVKECRIYINNLLNSLVL